MRKSGYAVGWRCFSSALAKLRVVPFASRVVPHFHFERPKIEQFTIGRFGVSTVSYALSLLCCELEKTDNWSIGEIVVRLALS
jgi:hypothetical protein